MSRGNNISPGADLAPGLLLRLGLRHAGRTRDIECSELMFSGAGRHEAAAYLSS